MTTTEIMAEIIAKQDELIILLDEMNFDTNLEKLQWRKRKEMFKELAVLNEQLKQAEAEVTEYELETLKLTPIPSGWICPRCQKVHSWMVLSCDCYPSVITASTTEPIEADKYLNDCIEKATPNLSKIKDVDKELAEIKGQTCDSCKYSTGYYRCVICDHYEKWEPIK